MTQWRDPDAYSPFARVVVEFMWAQRPPLQPGEFATRVGVRRQRVATWLNSDAVPPATVVVHMARCMGVPAQDLLIAAGHATADDPLYDRAGAWEVVTNELLRQLTEESADTKLSANERQAALAFIQAVQSKRLSASETAGVGD